MNTPAKEYTISDLPDLPKVRSGAGGEILPAGRDLCVLDEIRGIRVENHFTGTVEDKLDIRFKIDGLEAWCNGWYSPTNSKKGNLYKLMCEMSPSGVISEEIRVDTELFMATLRSFIGDGFLVAHSPSKSGKSNVINSVAPSNPYKTTEERKLLISSILKNQKVPTTPPPVIKGASKAKDVKVEPTVDDDDIPF